ncbi:unnamed protein product [Schistocephalus solidus]|uniref:Zinc finger with UFM1-specific peptidase domain protein n=2 Tax=Schistocephalus solidus TaxID=70667 RepID=A0A183SEG7_SCHSO|nr:unnamed protein product [Schistocephalus solidus]
MPSIWKLQTLLESAWQSGFDPIGHCQIADVLSSMNTQAQATSSSSSELSRSSLCDSTVWLGATDVAALLGYLGVKCCIVDCPESHQTGGYHRNLLKHLLQYFKLTEITPGSSNTPAVQTLPVYLQYEGHSLVVVGVEVDSSDEPIALMLLDPSASPAAMRCLTQVLVDERIRPDQSISILSESASSTTWSQVMGAMRMDASKFKNRSYQLIQVDGLQETEEDIQDAMIPENIRIIL